MFDYYMWLVAALAVLYSAAIRILQFKFIDRKGMKVFQERSKALNDKHKKASERSDRAAMDAIAKEQMELFPQMNKIMMGQLKTMAVILVIFFVFTGAVARLDPYVHDDMTIAANDDGGGCDAQAGDGILTACVDLPPDARGIWVAHAEAFSGDQWRGANATAFSIGENATDGVYLEAKDAPIAIGVDRSEYAPGDTVRLSVHGADVTRANIILDSGTRFYVDLPFTLPVINVQRIQQSYWWFIFVTIITGILISIGYTIYQKITKTEGSA